MKLIYMTHPLFLKHDMGTLHPECPERLRSINDSVLKIANAEGITIDNNPPKAKTEHVLLAHDNNYLEFLKSRAPKTNLEMIDSDTAMNPYTLDASYHCAGASITALDLIESNSANKIFCALRPPGHHASRNCASGFCFFNNIAIAALYAIEKLNFKRVAIIDFDVHHGNGTESIIANHPNITMLSTFEYPLYPFCGVQPLGKNMVNVPLSQFSTFKDIKNAVETKWDPEIEKYSPDLILVSAGYDAHQDDNISTSCWQDSDYHWLSQKISGYSKKFCEGRIVVFLEGGYNVAALTRNVVGFIKVLNSN